MSYTWLLAEIYALKVSTSTGVPFEFEATERNMILPKAGLATPLHSVPTKAPTKSFGSEVKLPLNNWRFAIICILNCIFSTGTQLGAVAFSCIPDSVKRNINNKDAVLQVLVIAFMIL